MTFSTRAALLFSALSCSLPALAIDWDWTQELTERQWRESSLTWARTLHKDDPAQLVLLMTTAPPPREMWCAEDIQPTQADCGHFDALLETWTRDFLSIPAQEPAPLAAMKGFPMECRSICS